MTFQYATNASTEVKTAHQRLSQMFNMGKYGERLAYEILDQYLNEWLDSDEDLDPWIKSQERE